MFQEDSTSWTLEWSILSANHVEDYRQMIFHCLDVVAQRYPLICFVISFFLLHPSLDEMIMSVNLWNMIWVEAGVLFEKKIYSLALNSATPQSWIVSAMTT